MIEFVVFLFMYFDFFIFVVCMKMMILLGIWFGRDDKGGFVGSFGCYRFQLKIDVKGYQFIIKLKERGIFFEDIGLVFVISSNFKEKREVKFKCGVIVGELKFVKESSSERRKSKFRLVEQGLGDD